MNPNYRSKRSFRAGAACACMLAAAILAQEPGDGKPGILKITIVDESTGQPTPARVELLDAQGKSHLAEDALLIGGDTRERGIKDWQVPWKGMSIAV